VSRLPPRGAAPTPAPFTAAGGGLPLRAPAEGVPRTDPLVLAAVGGVVGLVVAKVGLIQLVGRLPATVPRLAADDFATLQGLIETMAKHAERDEVAEFFEAGDFLAARRVDHQIPRNGEQPGVELRFAVVLAAALQHANPRFLEEVFSKRGIAREKEQITVEPLLVLLDQAVEQVRVALTQSDG